MAPAVTSAPAVFVALSYRHATAAKFPAQLDDTLDGLAWVHRNIVRWGGDARHIYLGGHSAGGHLDALYSSLPADQRPFDLTSDDPVRRQKVAALLKDRENVMAASPIAHVKGNRTPFTITHGSEDLPELIPQAMQMIAALKS